MLREYKQSWVKKYTEEQRTQTIGNNRNFSELSSSIGSGKPSMLKMNNESDDFLIHFQKRPTERRIEHFREYFDWIQELGRH